MDRTEGGRSFRILTVIDEFSRQCLAIRAKRRLDHEAVLETLSELFLKHGSPGYIRSDNGPEFTAQAVRVRLSKLGVKTLFIESDKLCDALTLKLESTSGHVKTVAQITW